jgi:hypothetical protein
MGINIRQSIPDFVSGIKRQELKNVDPGEFFQVDFIKKFAESPDFIKFMISTNEAYTKMDMSLLMVELKDQTQKSEKIFWVVAFLSPCNEVSKLNLPAINYDDYKDNH